MALNQQLQTENQQLQIDKEQLNVIVTQAIAEELIATAQLVLARMEEDYYHSNNFVFDGRGGTFKISTLEGQCLVHNQGGKAVITPDLTKEHIQALRQGRQQLAQAAKTQSKAQLVEGEGL